MVKEVESLSGRRDVPASFSSFPKSHSENTLGRKIEMSQSDQISRIETKAEVTGDVQGGSPRSSLQRLTTGFLESISLPLKDRNFLLLCGGQGVSTLGDAFYLVALPWIILSRGGSAQQLGIVLAAYGVTRLITILIGGMLSDRLRPRWVMLLADIGRAVLMGLMAFEVIGGHYSLGLLAGTAAGLGIFAGLFVPASFSILPDILSKEKLQAANALNSSILQLATLVGAGVGGTIIALFQPGTALVVDSLTFVVSAVTLAAISIRRSAQTSEIASAEAADQTQATGDTEAIAEQQLTFGQFLRTSRLFQATLLVVSVTFLTSGGSMEVALPAYARGSLATGVNGYGLLLGFFGAGELIGALLAGGLGKLPHRPVIVLILQIAQAITFVLLPLFSNFSGAVVVLVFAGVLNGLINVMYFTLIQEFFPDHLMGRIWGVVMFATYGLYPLSVILGGLVTDHFGPTWMFIASGFALILAATIGLLQREIREIA